MTSPVMRVSWELWNERDTPSLYKHFLLAVSGVLDIKVEATL
jgi:hypothetical protein